MVTTSVHKWSFDHVGHVINIFHCTRIAITHVDSFNSHTCDYKTRFHLCPLQHYIETCTISDQQKPGFEAFGYFKAQLGFKLGFSRMENFHRIEWGSNLHFQRCLIHSKFTLSNPYSEFRWKKGLTSSISRLRPGLSHFWWLLGSVFGALG